jgi:hypothetical protein
LVAPNSLQTPIKLTEPKIKLVVVSTATRIVSFMAHVCPAIFFETDVTLVVSHRREKALSAGDAFHA